MEMFSKKFKISNIQVSNFNKSVVIAEIGINHEGNFSRCIKMIGEAKKSGADLVKIQTYEASDLTLKSKNCMLGFIKK